MKKVTKGVLAAGAAVVLLLGTGGTLAYWNDSANLGGTNTITAGTLTVAASSTDPSWKIQHTDGAETAVDDISAVRIVPGDKLVYTVPATLTAQGQNLRFSVALAGGSIAAPAGGTAADDALVEQLEKSQAFTVAGVSPAVFTPVGGMTNTWDYKNNTLGTADVTITATIEWPFEGAPADDNPAKTGQVDLSQFAVTVTQVDGSAV